jgi:hypothetical protein
LRRHLSVRRAEINVSGSANSYRAGIAMNWEPSGKASAAEMLEKARAGTATGLRGWRDDSAITKSP